jgi:hypothetical protein
MPTRKEANSMAGKTRTQTIVKSSVDGTIKSPEYGKTHPKTTYVTTVKIPVPPKKKG